MTKVVYITGCLGFIGSYITRTCLEKGWYVKGVDKITYAARKDLLNEFKKYPNFSFVKCDINYLKSYSPWSHINGNYYPENWKSIKI
jgi:dTDP-D-glucose 4,6-dehydratase